MAVIVGAVGGLAIQAFYEPALLDKLKSTSAYETVKPFFDSCQEGYWTRCVSSYDFQKVATNPPARPLSVNVIDGDTIDYGGQRIRMVDYDTPEIGEPKCSSEYRLGQKAKHRLRQILNSGTVAITPHGGRDQDQYGRKLRLVTVNGRSVGDTLVAEGLAVRWAGRRHYWCG